MHVPYNTTRAVARSARGMVASPHPAATAAGAHVLRRGGNAVDAAIAANAVLAVVYPASCGLGGDALWLVYEPKRRETIAYNGSGGAASALEAGALRERGLTSMPVRGALSVTVPGAVRSWEDVAAAHGTRGFDELLAPAEACARDGFVVTDVVAEYFARADALLRNDADASALFLRDGAPRAGDVVRNEPLAGVLAGIRSRGAASFYQGPVAAAIAATLNAGGNPMSEDDLARHATEPAPPVTLTWKGATLCAHPPNSQASIALLVLGALANDGAANDLDWTHLAIEAVKEGFDLRDTQFADPRSMRDDLAARLAPEALAALRARLDPTRARLRTARADRGGTIAVVAADADGRAVSLIESLFMGFGSGLVARGTGIFLHNRGSYFSLEPGHPNELAGGKRPLHTLSPGMLLRDGAPELVYGTMGGDAQPQIHVQLLHNVYERGCSVQAAIDAPRFAYAPAADSSDGRVALEGHMPPEIAEGLRARGHAVDVLGAFDHAFGHAHAIALDHDRGTFAGGSDPRADSLALGV